MFGKEANQQAGGGSWDVAVLGGGPGGYVAALEAARLGARVVLVEKDRIGGTCLNIGCIPTKALTTAADLLVQARRAALFGVVIPSAQPDLPALMRYKDETVAGLVGGVEQLLRERRVTVVRGAGRLVRPDALRVTRPDGTSDEVPARHVILAPGSVTARPALPGLDLPGVMTSTQVLDIASVPPRLVVVGGGVIGLEFACIFEALGSRVTVLEMTAGLLPGGTDDAVVKRLALALRRRGMAIQTGATVQGIEAIPDGLRVRYATAGGEMTVEAERVLVATGRRPNTEDLGLEDVGVALDGARILVDRTLATNIPGVWAIGDAVAGPMLAHKAMVEGRVVAENVTGGHREVDHRSVPNVVFTRPEVASVGLTEVQARATGVEVKVSQFPFAANPRARILGESEGLARLVCEAGSGRVLGVHLMGPHATDLIAEGALAVQTGATADDLAWTCHGHPTLPEAMLEAALGFRDAAIHFHSR